MEVALPAIGLVLTAFGLWWKFHWTKRPTVRLRRLLKFLETKRVLYYPTSSEKPEFAIESMLEIRRRLGDEIERMDPAHSGFEHLNGMHGAALAFLDASQGSSLGEFSVFRSRLTDLQKAFATEMSALYSITKTEPADPPSPPSLMGDPVEVIYVREDNDEDAEPE